MIAYLFRFLDSDGKPTKFIGFAVAPDKASMFWQIDEHGDPNAVEIMNIPAGRGVSWCARWITNLESFGPKPLIAPPDDDEDNDEDPSGEFEEHELSETVDWAYRNDGWRKPSWKKTKGKARIVSARPATTGASK